VIAVAMGDHNGVEAPQIYPELLDVAREYARIVAGIEEDPTAAVLDECREPPVFLQRRRWPEGVVENRDASWSLRFDLEGRHGEEASHRDRKARHGVSPVDNRQLSLHQRR
jgi:hypothetical protein